MSDLTHVELLWLEKRIENWIRFGHAAEEQILDRRRRILSFAPGSIFAFVRWMSNDYGTVVSRLDVIRAVAVAAEDLLECFDQALRCFAQAFAVWIVADPFDQRPGSCFGLLARGPFDRLDLRHFRLRIDARKILNNRIHTQSPRSTGRF